eukprot:CAMPEP_0178988830 /NCGR_PEP_ID=MMETSP0795-20121207/4019_1 /TAXON_ID=88552 /ORGANISM="Amoebophrya sp., Strain Ameob2" /LENGTH=744 /DNA_ID=CAMNT_0020680129 /DNA_START=422 /DNA_END=2658 /DNA_ORIENTATION=-
MPPKKKAKGGKQKNKSKGSVSPTAAGLQGSSNSSSANTTPRHGDNEQEADTAAPSANGTALVGGPKKPVVIDLSQLGSLGEVAAASGRVGDGGLGAGAGNDGAAGEPLFQFRQSLEKMKTGSFDVSQLAPESSGSTTTAPSKGQKKYAEVELLKQQGNEMWKIGVHEVAVAAYSEAITKLQEIAARESADQQYDPARLDADAKTLISRLFANRSNCFYQLGRYPESLSDAQESFHIDPAYAKAWLRAAQACLKMCDDEVAPGDVDGDQVEGSDFSKKNLNLAEQYITEGLRIDPGNGTLRNLQVNSTQKSSVFALCHAAEITGSPGRKTKTVWTGKMHSYMFSTDGTVEESMAGFKTSTRYEIVSKSQLRIHAPMKNMPASDLTFSFPEPLCLKLEGKRGPELFYAEDAEGAARKDQQPFENEAEFFAALDRWLPPAEKIEELKKAAGGQQKPGPAFGQMLMMLQELRLTRDRCPDAATYLGWLAALRAGETAVSEKWRGFESLTKDAPDIADLLPKAVDNANPEEDGHGHHDVEQKPRESAAEGVAPVDVACTSKSTTTAPSSKETVLAEPPSFRASDLLSRFAAELQHGRDIVPETQASQGQGGGMTKGTVAAGPREMLSVGEADAAELRSTAAPTIASTTSTLLDSTSKTSCNTGCCGAGAGTSKSASTAGIPTSLAAEPLSKGAGANKGIITPGTPAELGCFAKLTQAICGGAMLEALRDNFDFSVEKIKMKIGDQDGDA